MRNNNRENMKKFLAVLALIIAVVLIGHVVSIISFNEKVHTVFGADDSHESYLDLGSRADSTSSWVKRDFDLYGETVDLKAQTIDGTFYNRSTDGISEWTMVIHIKEDCFINNAWCGTVEIHQFVGTEREKVQTLDLRSYKPEEIELEYLSDGDLLIPLQKGDFIRYNPSLKDHEMPLGPKSELTMGVIFYFLDSIDLSDYQVDYSYHRNFAHGVGFYALIVLAALWLLGLVADRIAAVTYRRALKDMELRKAGISCMSDIYSIIYIIDLAADDLIPVTADASSEKLRPKKLGAQAQLLGLVRWDAADAYLELTEKFVDLKTLPQRMTENSIACEYYSKNYGWCRLRFFAMDRAPDQPLKKAIFTIQVINAERQEIEQVKDKINQADVENRARSVFLDNMSREVIVPIRAMLEHADAIERESTEEAVRAHAGEIKNAGRDVLILVDEIITTSHLHAGDITVTPRAYSLKTLVSDVTKAAMPEMREKDLAMKVSVSPAIPDALRGDDEKLRQILNDLLFNAAKFTASGSVTLSVFGKAEGGRAHLLFSVKDTGGGIDGELDEDFSGMAGTGAMDSTGVGLSLVNALLKLMGSRLQLVTAVGEGCEFYFELDQEVIDPTPIGTVDFTPSDV